MIWLEKFRRSQWVRWLLQPLLILIPIGFVIFSLITNWQAMRTYTWQIHFAKLGLSLLILLIAFTLLPLASQRVLAGLGCSVSYRTAYYGYFVSQLAKYLPGGLWIVPGRALVLQKFKVNPISSSVGTIVETCGLIITGVIMFIPYLLFLSGERFKETWYLAGGIVVLILIALQPKVFNPLIRWFQARLGHKDVVIKLSWHHLISVLLIDLAFWCVTGAAFILLTLSIQPLAEHVWFFPSAFSFSWVIGFLAFLTPGGLGAREGVLTLLLAPFFVAPLSALIVLLARLWWTAADLVSVGLAVLIQSGITSEDKL